MADKFRKIMNILSKVVVVVVVAAALLLVGSRLAGLRPFVVLSGSMEPAYHVGSLIFVNEVEPEDVKVGDPITFVMNEDLMVATHRVVEIDSENRTFTTKGDANDYADGNPVHFNNLVGKPVISIPKAGYLVNFVKQPPGIYLAIAVVALIMLLAFLPDLFRKEEKKDKEKKNSVNS